MPRLGSQTQTEKETAGEEMRVYKSTYRDEKTGCRKKAETWSVDFVDHLRIRRRWPLGITDKRACDAIGQRIEELAARKLAGLEPDKGLTQWLETIPDKLWEKLVFIGLLDSCRAGKGKEILLLERMENLTVPNPLPLTADSKGLQWIPADNRTAIKIAKTPI